jgi:DNA-binding MarR family transcriptional regulator
MSRQLGVRAKNGTPKKKAAVAQTTSSKPVAPAADSIDELVRAWERERPDLESWPFAIFGRIWRLSASLVGDADRWLAPIGLTFESFSVIVTLRRGGPPFEMNPTALYRESLLSSGAITNRIDRVEAEGLVKRLPNPKDRRGTIVRLTPKGRALADRAIKLHFEALAESLGDLSEAERAQLAALLGKLLLSVEQNKQHAPRVGRGRPAWNFRA